MHYKHFNSTPDALEQYELLLKDDGRFVWLISRSAADGISSHDARGRWKRTGDTIEFETEVSSEGAPVPTTATVRDERLEVAGFGTFA